MRNQFVLFFNSILLVFILSGCDVPQFPNDISISPTIENYNWVTDDTGNFSYLEYIEYDDSKPFFLQGSGIFDLMEYEFPDNRFIYMENVNGTTMYGYMDENFTKLTYPISTEPNIFQLGLARIQEAEGSYIINSNIEKVEEYYPGYVIRDDSIIIVDWTYKRVSEPFVEQNIDYDIYLVPVKIYNDTKTSEGSGKYKVGFAPVGIVTSGVVTKEECTIQPIYEEARLFHGELAAVKRFGFWGFINEKGETVIECTYDEVYDFYNGVTSVFTKDLKGNGSMIQRWSVINEKGESLSGFIYDHIDEFHYGFAAATLPETWLYTYVGIDGKPINDIELPYVEALASKYDRRFHEGYVRVPAGYGCFLFDKNGEFPFIVSVGDSRNVSDGLIAVKGVQSPYWGYLNTKGEVVIGYKYEYVQDYDDGYAFVKKELDSPGYLINKEEEEFLLKLRLYAITKFNEGGYALAYAFPEESDKMNFIVNDNLEIEMDSGTKYYILKINGAN